LIHLIIGNIFMQTYQEEFIQLAIEHNALTFGDFTLKSGRKSPYFFNTGLFYDAKAIKKLGEFYAQAILHAGIEFDVLFGPAYKGIPLVTTTGIALCNFGKNYPLTFNRKEKKDHGEGGNLIGAPLENQRVLILDDVITAGTAFYESKALIESQNATLAGVVIALDRQEKRDNNPLSALQEIQQKEKIPVISLITLEHLISYLKDNSNGLSSDIIENMLKYKEKFGAR
jgi:orotate phosphoribosyltransferase